MQENLCGRILFLGIVYHLVLTISSYTRNEYRQRYGMHHYPLGHIGPLNHRNNHHHQFLPPGSNHHLNPSIVKNPFSQLLKKDITPNVVYVPMPQNRWLYQIAPHQPLRQHKYQHIPIRIIHLNPSAPAFGNALPTTKPRSALYTLTRGHSVVNRPQNFRSINVSPNMLLFYLVKVPSPSSNSQLPPHFPVQPSRYPQTIGGINILRNKPSSRVNTERVVTALPATIQSTTTPPTSTSHSQKNATNDWSEDINSVQIRNQSLLSPIADTFQTVPQTKMTDRLLETNYSEITVKDNRNVTDNVTYLESMPHALAESIVGESVITNKSHNRREAELFDYHKIIVPKAPKVPTINEECENAQEIIRLDIPYGDPRYAQLNESAENAENDDSLISDVLRLLKSKKTEVTTKSSDYSELIESFDDSLSDPVQGSVMVNLSLENKEDENLNSLNETEATTSTADVTTISTVDVTTISTVDVTTISTVDVTTISTADATTSTADVTTISTAENRNNYRNPRSSKHLDKSTNASPNKFQNNTKVTSKLPMEQIKSSTAVDQFDADYEANFATGKEDDDVASTAENRTDNSNPRPSKQLNIPSNSSPNKFQNNTKLPLEQKKSSTAVDQFDADYEANFATEKKDDDNVTSTANSAAISTSENRNNNSNPRSSKQLDIPANAPLKKIQNNTKVISKLPMELKKSSTTTHAADQYDADYEANFAAGNEDNDDYQPTDSEVLPDYAEYDGAFSDYNSTTSKNLLKFSGIGDEIIGDSAIGHVSATKKRESASSSRKNALANSPLFDFNMPEPHSDDYYESSKIIKTDPEAVTKSSEEIRMESAEVDEDEEEEAVSRRIELRKSPASTLRPPYQTPGHEDDDDDISDDKHFNSTETTFEDHDHDDDDSDDEAVTMDGDVYKSSDLFDNEPLSELIKSQKKKILKEMN